MNVTHLLDPVTASNLFAAGFGSTVYLVIRRNFGWSIVLTVFFVALVSAFYLTIPFALALGWSMAWYIFIAFCIGAFGFLIWGSIFNLLQTLHDDPQGTLSYWWRMWKGGGGNLAQRNPKDGGEP